MKIIWSTEALSDLEALRSYISLDNEAAAEKIALRIYTVAEETLANFPEVGKPGRVPGTREFVVIGTSYIIPYRVKDNSLHILRVYHSARKWPESF